MIRVFASPLAAALAAMVALAASAQASAAAGNVCAGATASFAARGVLDIDTGEVIAVFKPAPPDAELRQGDIAEATGGAAVPVSTT